MGLTWKGWKIDSLSPIHSRIHFQGPAVNKQPWLSWFKRSRERRRRRTDAKHVWHFYKLDRLRTVLTFSGHSFSSHVGRKKTKNIDCQSQQSSKGIFAFIRLLSLKPKQIQWMKFLFNKNSIMNRPAWSKALSLYLCAQNWTFINLLFLHIKNFEWAA